MYVALYQWDKLINKDQIVFQGGAGLKSCTNFFPAPHPLLEKKAGGLNWADFIYPPCRTRARALLPRTIHGHLQPVLSVHECWGKRSQEKKALSRDSAQKVSPSNTP